MTRQHKGHSWKSGADVHPWQDRVLPDQAPLLSSTGLGSQGRGISIPIRFKLLLLHLPSFALGCVLRWLCQLSGSQAAFPPFCYSAWPASHLKSCPEERPRGNTTTPQTLGCVSPLWYHFNSALFPEVAAVPSQQRPGLSHAPSLSNGGASQELCPALPSSPERLNFTLCHTYHIKKKKICTYTYMSDIWYRWERLLPGWGFVGIWRPWHPDRSGWLWEGQTGGKRWGTLTQFLLSRKKSPSQIWCFCPNGFRLSEDSKCPVRGLVLCCQPWAAAEGDLRLVLCPYRPFRATKQEDLDPLRCFYWVF